MNRFDCNYSDRASTDKQFCHLIVGLVKTLTVELVETLRNLHFFFSKKAKLTFPYFLEVDYQSVTRQTIKINLTILRNWLIDLLS